MNLCIAIQFVFSDKFSKMGMDEKLRLVHEGRSESPIMSVELELCAHAKGILPLNTTQLLLRREYNTQTNSEAFYMNNRPIVKSDLLSMFGVAGIGLQSLLVHVYQGRIDEISQMKESDLLTLLLDYSGSTFHE